jgi:hypothetical protein
MRILFTRPKWERQADGYYNVTGEAVDHGGNVVATSIPVRVTAEIIDDADKVGPGADALMQGIEQAVQGMARAKAAEIPQTAPAK